MNQRDIMKKLLLMPIARLLTSCSKDTLNTGNHINELLTQIEGQNEYTDSCYDLTIKMMFITLIRMLPIYSLMNKLAKTIN